MSDTVEGSTLCIMKPGYGAESLHLGQTESEVVANLGKPESRTRKYKGEYYYNYPTRGIEIDFGSPGGVVKHMFCFRDGFRRNRQANAVMEEGIKPGDSRESVLKALGEPDAQDTAKVLHSGDRLAAWFRYNKGVNFQFSDDGRVDMITITASV